MDQWGLWLPALPLVSAVLIHLLDDTLGRRVASISLVGGVLTLLLAACLFVLSLMGEAAQLHAFGASWGSLLFDPLSVLIALVIAGISLLISWYLVGVLLYFLLGHDSRSHSAYRYGFWTLITTGWVICRSYWQPCCCFIPTVAVPEEKVEPLLEGFEPFFNKHSGVVFISDIQVTRLVKF